jgi:hypothetical protein
MGVSLSSRAAGIGKRGRKRKTERRSAVLLLTFANGRRRQLAEEEGRAGGVAVLRNGGTAVAAEWGRG